MIESLQNELEKVFKNSPAAIFGCAGSTHTQSRRLVASSSESLPLQHLPTGGCGQQRRLKVITDGKDQNVSVQRLMMVNATVVASTVSGG